MFLMIPLLCICIETPCTPSAEVCSEPAATSGNVAGPVRGLLVPCATDGDVHLPCQVSESGFNVHQRTSVGRLVALEVVPSLELAGAMAAGEPATATAELPGYGLLSYCEMLA
jgi:hypothetical protein